MFYGWRMVAVAFMANFVWAGLGYYALPRLGPALAEAFSGGVTGATMLMSASMGAAFFIGPLVGRAAGRYPLRRLMVLGTLVMGLGFTLASQAGSLWQLYLVYSIAIPIGAQATSTIGASSLVTNWFSDRRALALGTAQVGLSLAGVLVVHAITFGLEWVSWRGIYLLFAGACFLMAPLYAFGITSRPSERGLHPDGFTPPAPAASAEPIARERRPPLPSARELYRDRNVILVSAAVGLVYLGSSGLISQLYFLAIDAGYEGSTRDWIVSAMPLGAVAGKLLFGWLGTRIGERGALLVLCATQLTTLVGIWTGQALLPVIWTSCLLFGMAGGGVMTLANAVVARLFGTRGFGPAMGVVAGLLVPFQIGGVPVAGLIRDWTGSYDGAMALFVCASALAGLAVSMLRIENEAESGPNVP